MRALLIPKIKPLLLSISVLFSLLSATAGVSTALAQPTAPAALSVMPIYNPGPPFADITTPKYPGLALGDIDGDGLSDALIGDYLGRIIYYHNGGGPNLGALFFREPLASYPTGLNINLDDGNKFVKSIPHPALVDYNHDGRSDLFIAGYNRNTDLSAPDKPTVLYYEQQANSSFLQKIDNPLSRIPDVLTNQYLKHINFTWLSLSVGDLTNDNLPDAVIGYYGSFTEGGTAGYYHLSVMINNASADPSELGGINLYFNQKAVPALADINGDGKLDLFVGFGDGTVWYYENTGTVLTPEFTQRTGSANPLNGSGVILNPNGPDVGRDAVPAFANLDGDGDLDALVASADGRTAYFRNDGTPTSPAFVRLAEVPDPFSGLDTGSKNILDTPGGSAIIFGDLDGDGRPDALGGGISGPLANYRNEIDSLSGEGRFRELGPGEKWFISPDYSNAVPRLVDLDANGTLDLVVSHEVKGSPGIYALDYYKNTGTTLAPNFVEQTAAASPFYDLLQASWSVPINAVPAFGDIDKDSALEMLIGGANGQLLLLRYNASSQQFAALANDQNPFYGVNIPYGAPFFYDYNNDSNLDCLIGEGNFFTAGDPAGTNGTIHYFQHRPSADTLNPVYAERTGADNPFAWFSVREYATPVLADLNNDSKPELVSGSGFGTFFYYPNVGSPSSPVFRDYLYNPLAAVSAPDPDLAYPISVNLWDGNRDGVKDAFIGTSVSGPGSKLLYYKNIGTSSLPVYRLQPESANPLSSALSPGTLINVSFGDTEGGGYPEAYVGGADSGGTAFLQFFRWNGSSYVQNSAAFAAQFTTPIPMRADIGPRMQFSPHPGTAYLDALIYLGSYGGKKGVYYAPNSGSALSPIYYYSTITDWLTNAFNPFYYAYQNDPFPPVNLGFNTAPYNASTLWAGDLAGNLSTIQNTFYDSAARRYYFAAVTPANDLLRAAHLPGPTLLSSGDLNSDGAPDLLIAAADGQIHFVRSSAQRRFLPAILR